MTRRQRQRRLRKWICVLPVFIAIIPTHLLCQCGRTLLELNCYRPYPNAERETKFHRCLFIHIYKSSVNSILWETERTCFQNLRPRLNKALWLMSGCSVLAQGFLSDFETNCFLIFFSSDGSYNKICPQIFYFIVPVFHECLWLKGYWLN